MKQGSPACRVRLLIFFIGQQMGDGTQLLSGSLKLGDLFAKYLQLRFLPA